MRAELESAAAVHLIAGLEASHAPAYRLDLSGEFHAEDVDPPRSPEAVDESDEKRIGAPQPPVRRTDRRPTHANEHLMLLRNGLLDVPDFDDVGWTVPVVDGGFHRRARSCVLTMLSRL